MFGQKRRILGLEASVAQLRHALETAIQGEGNIALLHQASENARVIAQLRQALDAPRDTPPQRAPPEGRALNTVYCAECTGYLSLYFAGGRTDMVSLRVGFASPPTQSVGDLNTRSDINAYVGTVVRRGEFWVAESSVGENSGVRCVFTPFA